MIFALSQLLHPELRLKIFYEFVSNFAFPLHSAVIVATALRLLILFFARRRVVPREEIRCNYSKTVPTPPKHKAIV